ncbi:glycosyltransferase family 2 protein [Exiguobacterium sp. s150]|uniref:glycosyltransferase family 2 protein n=1 Tax=Exiguobacterium sp. s150 TaxID=2751221 RepID=UPI0020374646|nr:glycosyltransferase family 2 protein [Exiguobacterium sp. s150]
MTYPNLEIIAVNDGSSDRTGDLLIGLADKHDRLRVIDCHENRGKANALHMAAHSEYLLCVDSDAFLDEEAPYQLVRHFLEGGERVGAVTGNPRIRNRDTLLSRMQIVEYASIIGSIKRTQRVMGKIMTVSGVIVMFRKKALLTVGL